MTQMTGKPYFWGDGEKGQYTEDDAIADLANLDAKLKLLKQTSSPAVAYVAYVVQKHIFPNGSEVIGKIVVILDKNDPTKVIGYQSFYGTNTDQMKAIKLVQSNGQFQTDVFGNIVTDGWYNVEKFILSDLISR